MKTIHEAPAIYLGFISLHLLLGHFGTSLVYRLRYGKSPLAYAEKSAHPTHTRVTRRIALVSLLWFASILASFSSRLAGSLPFRPLFMLPPVIGWVLGILGLVGMLSAQYQMGESFRIGIDASSARPALSVRGLHRFSRNPIYLFSFLYLVGVSLWTPSLTTLVSCALLGLLFHGLVLEEERFLASRLGEDYERYRLRVRRYL